MYHWQMVGKLFIPWQRTRQWYLCIRGLAVQGGHRERKLGSVMQV